MQAVDNVRQMALRLEMALQRAEPGSDAAAFWKLQLERHRSTPIVRATFHCPHKSLLRPTGNDQPEIGDRFRCEVCGETVWRPSEMLLKASAPLA